jgi:hypothetical protein
MAKTKMRPKAKTGKSKAKAKKATAKSKSNAKPVAAPKGKAKATPKAKAAPKAKPAANGASESSAIAASLAKLAAWAEQGGSLEGAAAADDATERIKAPQPEWGTVAWKLPPSYRQFLAHHSRLAIKWGENLGHDEFVILDPDEIGETGGVVYMPADVSRDEGVYLSTNHLVPFASGGNDECAFCFDVTRPSPDGEYPVYFHHQDEPRARLKDGGAWEDPENATPDFPSFAAWLAWVADGLSAGTELAHSFPSAFHQMPGRAK